MQTIFDAATCDELLRRVDSIGAGSARQWGKMSAPQMLEHTARVLEIPTGRRQCDQVLIRELSAAGEKGCDGRVHPFFGRLTGAEWGISQFKHLDHHLRQFGV